MIHLNLTHANLHSEPGTQIYPAFFYVGQPEPEPKFEGSYGKKAKKQTGKILQTSQTSKAQTKLF